ncbi:hypothetical protein A6V39_00210 [Candidatus Mycoplasma haematobovis]|uniref:Uncharacterized protein n=1 Tax=Candidatus Mycoplasma haematobovis TaxID=432608 RepID=A0A1A9QD09_9MOLU|nr:hypothetical protein [Candidatus Mycoplasma haematobovis]OAL10472.1 hypothetical protein A6V39_00210 [Candidatus Mycoplasma haematobovis]
MEGRLISYCYKTREDNENIEFAKETEEYQLVFKELRKNSDFINDIKGETNNITSNSEFVVGGKALEAWCEKTKNYYKTKKVLVL